MDIVQILGDYVHLLGMVILLAKLWLTKNCAGEFYLLLLLCAREPVRVIDGCMLFISARDCVIWIFIVRDDNLSFLFVIYVLYSFVTRPSLLYILVPRWCL